MIMEFLRFSSYWESNSYTSVFWWAACSLATISAVALLLLLKKKSFPTTTTKKNTTTTTTTTKKKARGAPICPFSKDTNFVVEMAETVPTTPLEQGADYQGPNAARWLAYGISGQDTPGKLRAGLKRLRDSTYFLVEDEDENLAAELLLKERNLTGQRRDVCFTMEDSSLPAQREVLDLFLHHLPLRYPDIYTYDAKSKTIHVKPPPASTASPPTTDTTTSSETRRTFMFRIADYAHAPLELCARIVQEDLILMRPEDGPARSKIHCYHMAAAAVVFSFRHLTEKLGQPAEFIHAPVPHFAEHIQKSLNMMFSNLSSEKPLWRNNWGLAVNGTLDEPLYGGEQRMNIVTERDVQEKFLKVEYQTIRRLPSTNYLLFTVKTMVNRLDELERVPTAAACLASSIRGMSPQMHKYKGIDDDTSCRAILRYLDAISSATTTTTTTASSNNIINNKKG
jgi:dimethylamine monooxygenase subunit A